LAGNRLCGLVLTHGINNSSHARLDAPEPSGEFVAAPIVDNDRVIVRAVAITAIRNRM